MKFFDYIRKAMAWAAPPIPTLVNSDESVQPPAEVHRCPMCGVRARFHVCDITREGRRVAQALICDEHSMYFIIVDKTYKPAPGLFERMAVDSINEGTVVQYY